jgi:cytoskeleton protein RodZ
MSEFGKDLRRERESRGIGLDSITDATKINNRYLLALEKGHFDYLPGGVFNKGIVRSYARVVGLDEEVWVSRYLLAYRESSQVNADDANWIPFAENVSKARSHELPQPRMRLGWAGVGVLLMVLTALGWFVWHLVGDKVSAAALTPRHTVAAQQAKVTISTLQFIQARPSQSQDLANSTLA